jgi:hypothetical protein
MRNRFGHTRILYFTGYVEREKRRVADGRPRLGWGNAALNRPIIKQSPETSAFFQLNPSVFLYALVL